MLKQVQLAVVAGLLSLSAFGQGDRLAQAQKLLEIRDIQKEMPELDLTPFEREFKYEAQGLALEERAKIETNLLAESIRKQVRENFNNALERLDDGDAAFADVMDQIETDIELFDERLREEMREIAVLELQNARKGDGAQSSEVQLDRTEAFMLEGVKQRSAFFNEIGIDNNEKALSSALSSIYQAPDQSIYSSSSSPSADRKSYKNDLEVLRALNSYDPGTKWITSGGWIMDMQSARRKEGRVGIQVKVEFLGQSVNAGASLFVKQEYIANLKLVADNKQLVVNDEGRFDFNERDSMGRIVLEKGKPKKRWLSFACEAILFYELDKSSNAGFVVSGGISLPVVGGGKVEGNGSLGEGETTRTFVNNNSRRLVIPESIGGQVTTLSHLKNICWNKYDKIKVNARMTLLDTLKLQVRNLVKNLTVKHPRMNCAVDAHCAGWYNKRYLNKWGRRATARCATNLSEHIRNCVVRSVRNQKCPVIEGGRLVSDGLAELPCDNGLKCVKVKAQGWFQKLTSVYQYAEGRCLPSRR